MKKVFYSSITKAITVILFVVCITFGVLNGVDGIATYFSDEQQVYGFEGDFVGLEKLRNLVFAPESAVITAYGDFMYIDDNENIDKGLTVDGLTVEDKIGELLASLYCRDEISYYVEFNGKVFTNCGATSAEELKQGQFYFYVTRNENGEIEKESSHKSYKYWSCIDQLDYYNSTANVTISTCVKNYYVEELRSVWEKQEKAVTSTIAESIIIVFIAVLLLVYLICTCGKDKDGNQKIIWLDKIWAELHAAVLIGSAVGGVMLVWWLLEEFVDGFIPLNIAIWLIGATAAIASSLIVTCLLSIVRNLKCGTLLKSSAVLWIIKILCKLIKAVALFIHRKLDKFNKLMVSALSRKSGVIMLVVLLIYTAVIGFFGILSYRYPVFIFFAMLLFSFMGYVIINWSKDLEEIKKGASEIRGGNLTYKIPEPSNVDMKQFADDINDIAKGLDESVSAKLKAERHKTELITNVSHDFKTPLTSIISYTELLQNMEELPQEAKDYIQIIAKKGDRLKVLTQDLFDISKVQSGNEKVVLEKLDVGLIINQILGERDNDIKASGLTFCVNADKELYVLADGRKMSRVINNLFDNIFKYTMKQTRVFVLAYEQQDEIVVELKNIASYPMDFNADEIVSRFVRGDESRTQEGNGLGLAIAKSYTEICGGKFDVVIDGDMFKAIIRFERL